MMAVRDRISFKFVCIQQNFCHNASVEMCDHEYSTNYLFLKASFLDQERFTIGFLLRK
jgi:hypothetical protein